VNHLFLFLFFISLVSTVIIELSVYGHKLDKRSYAVYALIVAICSYLWIMGVLNKMPFTVTRMMVQYFSPWIMKGMGLD
jgi:hypothetical protein